MESTPPRSRVAALAVHALTASGAVWGLLALRAIAEGRHGDAFAWMLVAVAVDGVDGALARRARVAAVVPSIDGALLDNLVDYLNFVVVPAFYLVQARPLPDGTNVAAAVAICLASGYQFSHVEAKTVDRLFRGFPSYWNLVVIHGAMLDLGPTAFLVTIATLTALVFAPVYFPYPTRTPRLRRTTLAVTVAWFGVLVTLVALWPHPPRALALAALLGPAYHAGLGADLTRRRAEGVSVRVPGGP